MIRLSTIGQVSVHIGDKPVPARNELIIAAVLYLVAERGRPIQRRVFADLFFPNAEPDGAAHSGRQLVYRLRKMGVPVEGDAVSIVLTGEPHWDVEQLLTRQGLTETELDALRRGYLADFGAEYSQSFSRWLDEHRSSVTRKLRDLLIRQIQVARSNRDFRKAGALANACLGLDPFNEEATLAAAESLAVAGAKTAAIHVLEKYLDEVGGRSDLRVAPLLLRERISAYVGASDPEPTPLFGRGDELATLVSIVERCTGGPTQACLISGQPGIGKTRLVDEACSIAALSGHAVAHVRLARPDVDRPFAILRDLGPTLLDLPGALGAAPEALAAVRGLCGLGPVQYLRRPANAYDARAVAADIQQKVSDLVAAVTDEQPLVIRMEDADYIDEASLELIEQLLSGGRNLCIVIASRAPVTLPSRLSLGPAVTSIRLTPLLPGESLALISELFRQRGEVFDRVFAENAVRIGAGVPLFMQLLFKNFLVTKDPTSLPPTLAASLTARLDHLEEPAKSVFDVIVTLNTLSTTRRIEQVTQLPRYSLTQALRGLEEQGFLRFNDGTVLPSHDLLADAARRRMPVGVSQLVHRTVAVLLEEDRSPDIDPLEIANHWQASLENGRALQILVNSARASIVIGRPRQAIAILQRAASCAGSIEERCVVDTSLLEAAHAAGEDHLGYAAAERAGLLSGAGRMEHQLMAVEMCVGAGHAIAPFRKALETIAGDVMLSAPIRGRAARLLVMIADDLSDATIGTGALELIADADDSLSETIIPRLIFETVFGLPDRAIALADRLLNKAVPPNARASELQALWTAARALQLCGERTRAASVAIEAFQVAKSSLVWSACVAFASMVGELAWEAGDFTAVQDWFNQGNEMLKRSGGPDRGYQHLGLGVSLAMHRGDPQAALALLDEAERLFPGTLRDRLGLILLANRTVVKLALGVGPSDLELEKLLEGFFERRSLGLHDLIADATIGALRHIGRIDQAQAIRDDYLTNYRRERTPVSPQFAHLSAEYPSSAARQGT